MTQLMSTSYKCGLVDREWILFFNYNLVATTILAAPSVLPRGLINDPRALLHWKIYNASVRAGLFEFSIALLCGFTSVRDLRHKAHATDPSAVLSPLEAQNIDAWDALVCQYESNVEGFLRSNRKRHARNVVRTYADAIWLSASMVCAGLTEEMLELLVHCYRKDGFDPPDWLLAILCNKRMLQGDRIR